jgi:hypothetical protein
MASPHVAGLAARIQNASLDPTAPGASVYFPSRSAGTRATPAEILDAMTQHATEKIAGRHDNRKYPLVTAKKL